MKRILFFVVSLVLLVSCGSSDSYRIKGVVNGIEDGTLMSLSVLDYDGLATLDSAKVSGGKFTIKGTTDTARIAVITFEVDDNIRGCQFFLERGDINVMIDAESGSQIVSGTPNNDALQKFYDEVSVFNDEATELEDKIRMTQATNGDCSDLFDQMGQIQNRFKILLRQSIMDNADKVYGYQQMMENYSMFEPDEVMEMLTQLAPSFGHDIAFNQLTAMINDQLSTSLGRPYLDFEASILDKKYGFDGKARLSDYVGKNKVVLLDFWASWCTPCMNELPNLKAAYKEFKSKGFEIVSVSVDEDTDDWIKAVKDNGMNWIQLWNGTEDMENTAAVKYSITAIPSTFLIDSEGTIIGRNLRDNEVADALRDYFSSK